MLDKSSREKRKAEWLSESLRKQEQAQLQKAIKSALSKAPAERDGEEIAVLEKHQALAAQVSRSLETRDRQKKAKAEHEREVEDPPDVLEAKLQELVHLIRTSSPVVFHVGAGLSTAAGIPDFRGPQGVWTLQKKGQAVAMRMRYEDAVPTKAHMAIAAMLRSGLISHVVSQNVDGLLLRAGVPPNRLSELHGCVYTEGCSSCGHVYIRSFDVTAANGSAFRRHATGRQCEAVPSSDSMTSAATSVAGKATSAAESPDFGEKKGAEDRAISTEEFSGRKKKHEKGLVENLDKRGHKFSKSKHSGDRRSVEVEENIARPICKELPRTKQGTNSESVANYERVDEVIVKPPQSVGHAQTDCAAGKIGPNKDTLRTAPEASEGADVAADPPSISGGSSEGIIIQIGEPLDEEAREIFKRGADVAAHPPLICRGSLEGTVIHFGKRLDEETVDVADLPPLISTGSLQDVAKSLLPICGGDLQDTIVHFGERLDDRTLRTAREVSEKAGLAVVLGTSLKVPPASTLPFLAKKVVIINLQWTAKDKKAALKVNGRCESVMERLNELLGVSVLEYHVEQDPILKGSSDDQGSNNSVLEGTCQRASISQQQKTARQIRSKSKPSFPRPQV